MTTKLREIAFRYVNNPVGKQVQTDIAYLLKTVVEERQRRIRMEWQITHDCAKHSEWADNPSFLHCAQAQHTWTDNNWRTEALRELDLVGVGLGEEG